MLKVTAKGPLLGSNGAFGSGAGHERTALLTAGFRYFLRRTSGKPSAFVSQYSVFTDAPDFRSFSNCFSATEYLAEFLMISVRRGGFAGLAAF